MSFFPQKAIGLGASRIKLAVIATSAALAVVLGYPVLLIVASSLNIGDPEDLPPQIFGLDNFAAVSDHLDWISNTLITAASATVLSIAIGIGLAWSLNRTNMPLRRMFTVLVALPYPLGPLVAALAWNALAAPRGGLLNRAFSAITGTTEPLINISSLSGISFVMALTEAPVAMLIIGAAMQRMDPSLEDCASIFGAHHLRIASKITLPIMTPAIINASLFVFVSMMGSFAIPTILGAGSRIYVVTTAIYVMFRAYPPNYPLAAVMGLVIIAITAVAVWLSSLVTRGKSYAVVSGKSYRPKVNNIGRLRWAVFAFVSLYVLLAVVLPVGALLLGSFQMTDSSTWDPSRWTLENYSFVLFGYPATRDAIINSLLLGIGTGALGVGVGTWLAWLVLRATGLGRRLLEYLIMVPQSFPRLIFAVGLLWMTLALPFPIYGTLWAVLLAYLVVFLPLAYRSMAGVLVQIDPALEEAARVGGAGWFRTMARVTFPLLRSGVIATWVLLFMVSIQEVNASVFLAGPSDPVLGPTILTFWDTGGFPRVSALAIVQAGIVAAALAAVFGLTGRKALHAA